MGRIRKRQKPVKKPPIGFVDRVLGRIEEDPEKFLNTAAQVVELGVNAVAAVKADPSGAARVARDAVVAGIAHGLRKP